MEVMGNCHGGQEHVGLRFTIDYLLFNKGSQDSGKESSNQSPITNRSPCRIAPDPSPRVSTAQDDLKLQTVQHRDSEGPEDDNGKEMVSGTSAPENLLDKPAHSYLALISMAILASKEKRLLLCDIYQWILEHYPYFKSKDKNWKNSVRHNLSLNECFVKAGRSDNGKGHFWAIHPANLHDFSRGDFHRRRARRRVRGMPAQLAFPLPSPYLPPRHPRNSAYCFCPPSHQLACCSASISWNWHCLGAMGLPGHSSYRCSNYYTAI
ncbi:forkhead box Q2 [Paramormyrops kingsleyae]|uniref:forkhead box Q2 n=1 Tax=Paramormyrops kingsleyae TaxID=1676925 RepID=UPI000CD63631|nr:forkhead box protein F1-like [Paramormyrops kingsleyae]